MGRRVTSLLARAAASAILGTSCAPTRPGPIGISSPAGSPPSAFAVVPVTRVVDGDTVHARYGGRDERARLIGVNTPEVPGDEGIGQCFGPEAAAYTTSRLSGRRVRLRFDRDVRDRYGRLLAYVYLGDELFNLTLVRAGYATADPVPPDTGMAAAFAAAQQRARSSGASLWSACRIRPWPPPG